MASERERLRQEARAWEECAVVFSAPRTRYICNMLRNPEGGCYWPAAPRQWPRPAMLDRIEAHMYHHDPTVAHGGTLNADDDDPDNHPNHPRVIFSLLMAHECRDEARPTPRARRKK